jgi:hypothetical protein
MADDYYIDINPGELGRAGSPRMRRRPITRSSSSSPSRTS